MIRCAALPRHDTADRSRLRHPAGRADTPDHGAHPDGRRRAARARQSRNPQTRFA